MDYQAIMVTERDGYGVITLNRPDVKNALNVLFGAGPWRQGLYR